MASPRSTVVSLRLPAETGERLERLARRHGWSASDTTARLVEEGLRRSEFPYIDFRDSAAGRQAYVQGSSLAVWEVSMLLRSYHDDVAAVAKHLGWPEYKVTAAVKYAEAFPSEIHEALAANDAVDFPSLKRIFPHAEQFDAGES